MIVNKDMLDGTMVVNENSTIVVNDNDGTMVVNSDNDGTMVVNNDDGTMVVNDQETLRSGLGTMVINDEDEEDGTMKSKLLAYILL